MIENYKCKFKSRGKWIFEPNEACIQKGRKIIDHFENVKFPDYFFHYAKGGHVAALHSHLKNQFFFKIDIKNFFYSISRNRVTSVLHHWKCFGSYTLAQWSCVANPHAGMPLFALPIGFVQSSLLASLALMRSEVSEAIEQARAKGVEISVYLDDIIGSHQNPEILATVYENILSACVHAKLLPNAEKLTPPKKSIIVFNCDLAHGLAEVTDERVTKFSTKAHSPIVHESFQRYRHMVASANKANLDSH